MHYDRPKKASCVRIRLIIAIMTTFCPIVCYIGRQNLSMAIVSMVKDERVAMFEQHKTNLSATTSEHQSSSLLDDLDAALGIQVVNEQSAKLVDSSCLIEAVTDESGQTAQRGVKSYGPKYEWETEHKSLILSAFFWTYVIFQIPGARIAERLGAKWILATAALGSAVLSFASPWAASLHPYALALVRAFMGVCQTALYPACYVLYSKWLPPVERSLAIPILCVGAYVGSIVASLLTGFVSEQPSLGWHYAFHAPGLLCAIWFLLWVWLGANEPREHKSISSEEIEYIESKMEVRADLGSSNKKEICWSKVFSSQAIWAMIMAFVASNWSFSIVLLLLPSYLNDILHIPPFKNGLINSVIYGLYCISSPILGSTSTMMVETRAFGMSRLNIRKLFQCTALFGQAICFVALPLIGCDQSWVLAFLFLQIVLFAFTSGGEVHLPTEISVDFSGTIYAIGNCAGSATGVIAPLLHSAIVDNARSREQWDLFFYLAALICAIGGLIFAIFGRNQLQDFSKGVPESQLDICQAVKGASSFSLTSTSLAQQPTGQKKKPAPPLPPAQPSTTMSAAVLRAAWMESAIRQQQEHN